MADRNTTDTPDPGDIPNPTDIDALRARMTLDEKLAQLGCVWCSALVRDEEFSASQAEYWLRNGIGEITRIGATTGLDPRERAAFANAIQRFLVEETRLGIPAIVHEESVAGLCARDATQFPQAIGLAATWNPELIERIGVVIREQMVATGARHTLSPVLDVARDPRWGRTEETYGESPYLAARLGVAYVRGVQGAPDDGSPAGGTPADGDPVSHESGTHARFVGHCAVAATGKHFLGYGMAAGGLNHAPVHFGPRELREVYAEPFRAAIHEAGLATVMNSYSSVDGLPCGGSKAILDDLLRGELGFTGAVVADYSTTELLMGHHRIAATKGEAAARALTAGLDMELPQLDCYGAPLRELVEAGDVDVALVDRSVRRVLELKHALGLFDDPYVDVDAAADAYGRASDTALAYEAAVASMVLLRNDGTLPLHADADIAVFGAAADDPRLLQGDYSYPTHTEIVQPRGADGNLIEGSGRFAAGPYFPATPTPLAAVRDRAGGTVTYVQACSTGLDERLDDATRAEVTDAARAADVAVCVVGARSGLLPDCTSGEFRDVTDLSLTAAQREMIATAAATGTPTVVVVMSGRVHALADIVEHTHALLYAWLPGEEGGNALADVLFGVAAPSGKLPISLPRSAGQVPVHHDTRAGGSRSMIYGDYADAPTAPLFPFGFGLSYTTFAYADLQVVEEAGAGGIEVEVTVRNTGDRPGTEVVQLFAHDEHARVARPVRQLVGFTRVALAPGVAATVRFRVDPTAFAYYDEDMHLVVEPGAVRFSCGGHDATATIAGPERTIGPNDRVATAVEVRPHAQ